MITRAFAAIVGTALLAAPALAEPADLVSVDVRVADLDLGTQLGRDRLDRRVRQAAGQICGQQPRSVAMQVDYQRCRSEVLDDAQVKIARMLDNSAPIRVARRTR
jgi:UrcA family protein